MNAFIQSAESRETSPELMSAILEVAGGDPAAAESIWENGPTATQLASIIEAVTEGGQHDTTDFYWGAEGDSWASAGTYRG